MALAVAAHGQVGGEDGQPVQAQFKKQQGTPAEHGFHIFQLEGGTALLVANFHPVQIQARTQPLPVGIDAGDRHRELQGAAERDLHVIAVMFDLGQDQITQGEEDRHKHEIRRQPGIGQPAQQQLARGQDARRAKKAAKSG